MKLAPAGTPTPGKGPMPDDGAIAVEAGAANAVVGAKAAELAEHQAADPQTGLGAGDVKEAGAIGVADADIFDRRRLGGRQIGGAGPRRQHGSGQACSRTQKKSFEQFHVNPQSPSHVEPVPCSSGRWFDPGIPAWGNGVTAFVLSQPNSLISIY